MITLIVFFTLAIVTISYGILFHNDNGDYGGFLYLIAGGVFFVCGILASLIVWLI